MEIGETLSKAYCCKASGRTRPKSVGAEHLEIKRIEAPHARALASQAQASQG